jgi:hypothetical protein
MGFVRSRPRCFALRFAEAAFFAFAEAFGLAGRRFALGRLAERAFR